MHYIVIDLEWNQTYHEKAVATQKELSIRLRGEVIQIGAVKLDESLALVGSYRITVKPKFYKKIHRHVMRLTGIDQAQLDHGVPLAEAMESFHRFCGDDAVFLTWGPDDMPMLFDNLRANKLTYTFLDKYYDKKTCTFYKSTEASDAYGYDIGYGNEKTLQAIVDKYEKLGEFDTGIFGTKLLIKVLCENGHSDLAFKLLSSKKENTFYNMKKQGATTLWENWDGAYSHNHPMFGAVVESLVKYFNEI